MKDTSIKKVLVIGSGPIVIGQAAEFDYAGTQACRALREEGVETVLLNSNPATIMTDKDIADHVYIEPLTVPVLKALIEREKPDSILPTMGGQAGLNLAMALADEGFLEEKGVRLIGASAETIRRAEDRLLFKETMQKISEPVADSEIVHDLEAGLAAAERMVSLQRSGLDIRSSSGLPTPSAVRAAELRKMNMRAGTCSRADSGSPVSTRSLWSARLQAGKRSSTRSCGIFPAT